MNGEAVCAEPARWPLHRPLGCQPHRPRAEGRGRAGLHVGWAEGPSGKWRVLRRRWWLQDLGLCLCPSWAVRADVCSRSFITIEREAQLSGSGQPPHVSQGPGPPCETSWGQMSQKVSQTTRPTSGNRDPSLCPSSHTRGLASRTPPRQQDTREQPALRAAEGGRHAAPHPTAPALGEKPGSGAQFTPETPRRAPAPGDGRTVERQTDPGDTREKWQPGGQPDHAVPIRLKTGLQATLQACPRQDASRDSWVGSQTLGI